MVSALPTEPAPLLESTAAPAQAPTIAPVAAPKAHFRKRLAHWLLNSPLLGRSALVLAGIGLLLAIFSLAAAAGNTRAWAENYTVFLTLNVVLSAALGILVMGLLIRLLWRLQQAKFGARLTLKFAGAFATLALLPGVLVYLVSILFLHQSIEGWFNVRVNTALEAGIELSRAAMDGLLQDLTLRARAAASTLDASDDRSALAAQAGRIQAANPSAAVLLFDGAGQLLASAGTPMSQALVQDTPSASGMQVLRRTGVYTQLESQPNPAGGDAERLSLRAVVTVPKFSPAARNALGGGATLNSAQSLGSKPAAGALGINATPKSPASEAAAGAGAGTGLALKPSAVAGLSITASAPPTTAEPSANPAQGLSARPTKTAPSAGIVYLQLTAPVPSALAQWAQAVTQGLRDYETLALGRAGLRKIYAATLTLTMLLSVLAAVAAGFVLADAMSAPLLRLARGTQAVAAGDFTPLPVASGKDDLAVLTRSFNKMSFDLGTARGALTRSNDFLEQVLRGLTTGVVVLDAERGLRNANPAAMKLLAAPDEASAAPFALPAAFLDFVLPRIAPTAPSVESAAHAAWQAQPEFNLRPGQPKQTFLLSASPIALDDGQGTLLVFDDISAVLVAQRAQAWAEVAQRLAHEIKNPLTPIQLSAERLAMKLESKVQGADADLLKRATGTIVAQVAALKTLVDEFRNYARLPQAKLKAQPLHPLLTDVLSLYASTQAAQQSITIALEASADQAMLDADQLRQVLHNLVGNALDAAQERHAALTAAGSAAPPAQVHISTRDHAQGICLRVADNGAGFSPAALARLFEPYHTTKTKGTGLGLAIVQRIVLDHGAVIQIKQLNPGAAVDIVFPVVVG